MKLPRGLWLVPPVVIGAALAAWLISQAEPPARVDNAERSVVTRTVLAEAVPIQTILRGYGNVQSARSWVAVAEVAGTIIWRHPDLEAGNIIPEGTRVLTIDPTMYELAIAQAEADLDALDADLAQLAVDETNTGRLLALEESRLELAEAELMRIRGLAERGVAAQSALDAQERTTLQVRRGVEELRNAHALIPSRRARLDAQMARTEATLARARHDLEKTEITVPFDMRVVKVHVEHHQFAGIGQPLVTADGIDQAEIIAQIPVSSFRRLMEREGRDDPVAFADHSERFAAVTAEVRLVSDPSQTWAGRLVRVESTLDPQARSVPAVVAVDDPYAGASPPLHLALLPNMYVEVTLTGQMRHDRITVPDSAVHQGDIVYLRDGDGRLELREVSIGWKQEGVAILQDGIAVGEEIILDDLIPAIPGMLVEPTEARG